MRKCYEIIGVDFPERGFFLFWQLDLDMKLQYFIIEDRIVALREIPEREERKKQLMEMLKFLGQDPIAKVDLAFQEKYNTSLLSYLDLS